MRRMLREHPAAGMLAAQLAVVLGYPFLANSGGGRAALGVVQLLAVAAAMRAVHHTTAFTRVAVLLGVPAMVFAVLESVRPNTDWVLLVSVALHVPFYVLVSYALLGYVFKDDVVSSDEIVATGAAFTVVAWAFAYLYEATQVLWPGSFGPNRPWFELLFLSFTALTSVGLSDFGPMLDHAKSIAIVEQVIGVFYVALVVSRLVGLGFSRSQSSDRPVRTDQTDQPDRTDRQDPSARE